MKNRLDHEAELKINEAARRTAAYIRAFTPPEHERLGAQGFEMSVIISTLCFFAVQTISIDGEEGFMDSLVEIIKHNFDLNKASRNIFAESLKREKEKDNGS